MNFFGCRIDKTSYADKIREIYLYPQEEFKRNQKRLYFLFNQLISTQKGYDYSLNKKKNVIIRTNSYLAYLEAVKRSKPIYSLGGFPHTAHCEHFPHPGKYHKGTVVYDLSDIDVVEIFLDSLYYGDAW